MALYRCHFLDALDNVNAQEEIDAGSLLDAVERATAMLDRRSDHDALEIWAGNRWDLPRRPGARIRRASILARAVELIDQVAG